MRKLPIAITFLVCFILAGCCSTSSIEKRSTTSDIAADTFTAEKQSAEPEVNTDNAQLRREYLQQYRFDDSVNQVLIVTHTEGWNAIAYYYEKQPNNNAWTLTFQTDAYIGKGGMNKTQEGDAKTPCGDFAITGAFGILDNPGTALNYISITPTTYACDEDCEYYNQIIDIGVTGHECTGEEMYALSPEYNYGLTTSYNEANTYPNGSAIFIHCKGQKPFTGGCVALDQSDMEIILTTAEPGMRIYLDEFYIQSE